MGIRKSLLDEEQELLEGICEIDGVYVGGKTKQVDKIEDRVDKRTINHPNYNTHQIS